MPVALVTGATGQDGGFLVERLLAEGVEVHCVVHEGEGPQADLARRHPTLRIHHGDLASGAGLRTAIERAGADEIYNLAGISSVSYSWSEPVLTAEVSGVGVLRLLDEISRWARGHNRTPRFVQASSAEIFGNPAHAPQDEQTPINPLSPYGAAKALAHHAVGVFRAAGMNACSAILYNHESPRRPPTFVTRKISQAVAAIAYGSDELLVLGNVDARRDWGWAPDYVDAMVRIVRHDVAQDYVVATGESHSVADFVASAFAHVGIDDWQAHVRTDPSLYRPADATELVGDASRLRTLGWQPSKDFAGVVAAMVDADLAAITTR